MINIKNFILTIFVVIILVSCEDRTDLTEPGELNTGTADFSSFVSIGNSLTAGYQNSALYESSQEYSYGQMIANQVGVVYEQPILSNPGIGGRMDVNTLVPFSTVSQPSTGLPTNSELNLSYNNLGIPGIVLADVLSTSNSPSDYVGINPFIDIILRNKGTVLEQTLSLMPTFITVWIGNNDILGYATSGGLRPYTPTNGPLSFGELYLQLLTTLSQAGIQNVVVANIPDVSSIPFFTTVGGQLLLQGKTSVMGTKSDNTIAEMNLSKNLLTLRASEELADGKGTSPTNPLSNGVILDEEEINIAKSVIASYNSSILTAANQFGYKVVDINDFFNDVAQNGIKVDGIELSSTYVTGGIFSLDGVHPTSQGYAIVANKFIEVINDEYSANIPYINISTVPGSISLGKRILDQPIGLPNFDSIILNSIFY